jgi:hypothetical protein
LYIEMLIAKNAFVRKHKCDGWKEIACMKYVSKTSLEIYRYQNAIGNEGIKNVLAIVIAKRV